MPKNYKIPGLLDNIKINIASLFDSKSQLFLTLIITLLFIGLSIYLYYNIYIPIFNKNHQLNKEFIDKQTTSDGKKEIIIIYFYTEWCPYCKKAKPEWQKFEDYIKNYNKSDEEHKVTLISVDCDKDTKTANKYKINGYPTIKLIKDEKVNDFDARPSKDTLVQFLNSYI
tara:strand:- start:38 stop:547 length:510 start_codon:yes stop_codon:yes gene_type:complete